MYISGPSWGFEMLCLGLRGTTFVNASRVDSQLIAKTGLN
jgi:hypothetical protein